MHFDYVGDTQLFFFFKACSCHICLYVVQYIDIRYVLTVKLQSRGQGVETEENGQFSFSLLIADCFKHGNEQIVNLLPIETEPKLETSVV